MNAVLCPVCNGTGKVSTPNNPNTTGVNYPTVCHGCSGKGWVEVGNDTYIYPYYPYYPNPYPNYPLWWHEITCKSSDGTNIV
jgi:hypothetical protein